MNAFVAGMLVASMCIVGGTLVIAACERAILKRVDRELNRRGYR